jgi:hypothetical protein
MLSAFTVRLVKLLLKSKTMMQTMNVLITQEKINGVELLKKVYHQKIERFFERAINEFNKGHIYNAMQTAKYALHIARRFDSGLKSRLCGFIAQIKLDLNQFELAEYYCLQAIQYLNKKGETYHEDKKYFSLLLRQVNKRK